MEKVLIYGYGVSGKGAHKLLLNKGYDVDIFEDGKSNLEDYLNTIKSFDFIIKSPGIPNNTSLIEKADKEAVEIIDEIEFAYRNSKYKIIAVTGTNGKTTVTTKIGELLNKAGFKAECGGNIGKSFSEIVYENRELDYVILELSSYQLERVKSFNPNISIITNLTPDHLSRYNNIDEYYNSKFSIIMNSKNEDVFILNKDDLELEKKYKEFCEDRKAFAEKNIFASKFIKNKIEKLLPKTVTISKQEKADIYVDNSEIKFKEQKIIDKSELSLKGNPNLENMLFVSAVAKIVGISNDVLADFLKNTKHLEHRMEDFYTREGIKFINDSKGTNTDATIKALEGFEEKVILICGGKDKKLDLEELVERILQKSKLVYLIGETSDLIESMLILKKYDKEKIRNLKSIENVIEDIFINRNEISGVVLFSPAASSFDQFKNFEVRGERFKELVLEKFGGK